MALCPHCAMVVVSVLFVMAVKSKYCWVKLTSDDAVSCDAQIPLNCDPWFRSFLGQFLSGSVVRLLCLMTMLWRKRRSMMKAVTQLMVEERDAVAVVEVLVSFRFPEDDVQSLVWCMPLVFSMVSVVSSCYEIETPSRHRLSLRWNLLWCKLLPLSNLK